MKTNKIVITVAAVILCSSVSCVQNKSVLDGLQVETCEYAEKEGEKLYLDIYVDSSVEIEGKRPVFIFSFGGGWESGSRGDGKDIASFFAGKGYLGVAIDYRLLIREAKEKGVLHDNTSSQVFWNTYVSAITAGVEDLYDATSFIVNNAEKWNADPNNIVIAGSSAGATNSNMAEYWLCNETEIAAKHLPTDFRYAGVISAAGGIWKQGTEDPVWKNKPCPILMFHGDKDQLVPYGKVTIPEANFGAFGPEFMAQQLSEMEVPHYLYTALEADHIFAGLPLTLNLNDMYDFIQRIVIGGEKVVISTIERYLDEPRTIMQWLMKEMAKKQQEEASAN